MPRTAELARLVSTESSGGMTPNDSAVRRAPGRPAGNASRRPSLMSLPSRYVHQSQRCDKAASRWPSDADARQALNRNYCPQMLREPHRWAIDVVCPDRRTATMTHGWVSAGVSFWSAPPHDPEGAVSPADPARISRHSGHSTQPAVPPREAGALYPRKNHGKVPPPLQQDPRDPPHSHGNAPMTHRCGNRRAPPRPAPPGPRPPARRGIHPQSRRSAQPTRLGSTRQHQLELSGTPGRGCHSVRGMRGCD